MRGNAALICGRRLDSDLLPPELDGIEWFIQFVKPKRCNKRSFSHIYIMMKCLCVCHEKWALSPPELSAELWPSDHDDKDDRDDNEDDAW